MRRFWPTILIGAGIGIIAGFSGVPWWAGGAATFLIIWGARERQIFSSFSGENSDG